MSDYERMASEKAQAYRKEENKRLLLAIESSCDETAAAVIQNGFTVRSMAVHTQIPLHRKYGGVVPEIASRSHVERVGSVVDAAINEAGVSYGELDAVAATYGPGLVGALLVGLSFAKGVAYAKGLPLVGVNHIKGHIAANYLTYADLKPPFVCLVASGGHSHIVKVESYSQYRLLGRTRDDAAGEAFDKAARVLGLSYPGGPELEKLAKNGDPLAYKFSAPFNESDSPDFSFSGIKTALINLVHTASQRGEALDMADVAASFQHAVVETLAKKSIAAALAVKSDTLALAGGVSANMTLRARMRECAQREGLRFCCPDMKYCTDNAAMIGCAGHIALMEGEESELSLNAQPGLKLV